MSDQPLVLCNFPFVMDLKSKKMVFDMNARFMQVTKVEDGYLPNSTMNCYMNL